MAYGPRSRPTFEGPTAHAIAVGPSRPSPRAPAVRCKALCLAIPALRIGCYAYPVNRWRCSGGSMLRAQRHTQGSVRFDKRRKTWNYLWYDAGTRRSRLIGTKQDFPNKAAAWRAVKSMKPKTDAAQANNAPSVNNLFERYKIEKMPQRRNTKRTYIV